MAVTITPQQQMTFKKNLETIAPYQSKDVIDELIRSIYLTSTINYSIGEGPEKPIILNGTQLYSGKNITAECKLLCSKQPLLRLYKKLPCDKVLDNFQNEFNPDFVDDQEEVLKQQLQSIEHNEEILNALAHPQKVDTSPFPEIARNLNIVNVSDRGSNESNEPPLEIDIYGLCAAHLVEYIHNIYPTVTINVHLVNPSVTALLLAIEPRMGQRLAGEHVKLFLTNEDTLIKPNCIVLIPEIVLLPEHNILFKLRLNNYLEVRHFDLVTCKRAQRQADDMHKYTLEYAKKAEQFCVEHLGKADTICLVFPGRNMVRTFERLKELKEKGAYVIASDSSLIYLEQKDFVPDLVVANNKGFFKVATKLSTMKSYTYLKPDFYKDSTLLFTSRTHLLIPAAFTGKKYIIYSKDMGKAGIRKARNAMTDLNITPGTVGTIMMTLAHKMKAKTVYFFGLDGVFRSHVYYAGIDPTTNNRIIPTFQRESQKLDDRCDTIECGDGKERRAYHPLSMQRFMIEQLMAKYDDIEYFNVNLQSAVVHGATIDGSVLRGNDEFNVSLDDDD